MGSPSLFPGVILPDPPPAVLTSLDPIETSGTGQDIEELDWRDLSPGQRQKWRDAVYSGPPAQRGEIEHRHGDWLLWRSMVQQAMADCSLPEARRWRFDNCGANAWIECATDNGEARLRANFCHDRFCLPCACDRARRVCRRIAPLAAGKKAVFVTLTLRHRGDSLHLQISRLLKSFNRLRKTPFWHNSVTAGLSVLEVKRSKDGQDWHAHLHAICLSQWCDQSALRDEWQRITGDSNVCNVKLIRDEREVSQYVTKYATKPFDPSIFQKRDWLQEALLAMRGRRMFTFFGDWYNLADDERQDDQREWRAVAPLLKVLREAQDGQAWAQALLAALQRRDWPTSATTRPQFVSCGVAVPEHSDCAPAFSSG